MTSEWNQPVFRQKNQQVQRIEGWTDFVYMKNKANVIEVE